MRGVAGRGLSLGSGPSSCPYSPKCLEVVFCELRLLSLEFRPLFATMRGGAG
jgi:hypothetical protein